MVLRAYSSLDKSNFHDKIMKIMNCSKEHASSPKSQVLMVTIGLLQIKMLTCFGDGFCFVSVR